MKKEDLVNVLNNLNEIKSIADKQEYVVSKSINQLMNNIKPILNDELKRMDMKEVECNSPEIKCMTAGDLQVITELMNDSLAQLVKEDYKIIDYNITFNNTVVKPNTYSVVYFGQIKYTS